MIKILLFAILIYILIIYSKDIEGFMDFTDMIEFKRLDDSLIKKYKINTTYNLYDNDINFLFRNDNVIRVYIPFNHYVKLIYKYKEDNKKTGYAKTIELVEGEHDIKKEQSKDKVLDQIMINNIGGMNIFYEPYIRSYTRIPYFYPSYSYRTINYPRHYYKRHRIYH
jgi:hypothetical protein